MPYIVAYPGVYDSTDSGGHIRDRANAIATKTEQEKFGKADRSEQVI